MSDRIGHILFIRAGISVLTHEYVLTLLGGHEYIEEAAGSFHATEGPGYTERGRGRTPGLYSQVGLRFDHFLC